MLFSPSVLWAGFFLLLALYALYIVKTKTGPRLLNAGIFIGMAGLLIPSIQLYYFCFIWLMFISGQLRFRGLLKITLGLLSVYFLCFSYSFAVDQHFSFLVLQFTEGWGIFQYFNQFTALPGNLLLRLGIIAVCLMAVLFSYDKIVHRRALGVQKVLTSFYVFMLFSVVVVLVGNTQSWDLVVFLLIPLGALFAELMTKSLARWAEIIHIVLILVICLLNWTGYV